MYENNLKEKYFAFFGFINEKKTLHISHMTNFYLESKRPAHKYFCEQFQIVFINPSGLERLF